MVSITLICVGKCKEKFYLDAAAEYEKRLKGYAQFKLMELPECRLPDDPSPAEIAQGLSREAEADEAKTAIEALGGRLSEIREYPVGEATHRIVVVEKVRLTPKAYPRKFAKIKQQPL